MAKARLIYLLRRGTLRQSLAKERNVFHAEIKLPNLKLKWNEPSNWVLAKKGVHIIYMLSLLKREDQIYSWPLKLALSDKYVCGHDKDINLGHIKVWV